MTDDLRGLLAWMTCGVMACGAAPRVPAVHTPAADTAATETASAVDFFACASDDVCVAIPESERCDNGILRAIHRDHIEAFRARERAKPRGCPLILVNDRRSPRCVDGRCKMILVEPPAAP